MNEPFSWLTVFSKLGVPGTAILAVVLGIAGAVGTNVGNVRERAMAFLDYERNEINYNNSDGNIITNAPSVAQTHEHPEIDGRFNKVDERFNKVDARFNEVDGRFNKVEGRLTNLEHGQAAIYGRLDEVDERLTNLEQGQVEIKADLQGVKAGLGGVNAGLAELKATLQKLLEKP